MTEENRAMLARVARALGRHCESVVFVGGTLPAVYELDARVSVDRGTLDVDVAVPLSSRADYDAFVERLRKDCGLLDILDEDAPICRFRLGEDVIDIMPTDRSVLHFGNRWFEGLVDNSMSIELEPGLFVRVASPVYFIATKLEALCDRDARGEPDLTSNRDLEDLITVLRGLPDLFGEIANGDGTVHEFIRQTLAQFLHDLEFRDAIPLQFEADMPTQATIPRFMRRLEALASGQIDA